MPDAFFAEFAQMLRADAAVCVGLSDQPDGARLAVYRNNTVRAAIEALRAAYPTVNRLTGERFFSPMAKDYWRVSPPDQRSLTLYGEHFDRHIATYSPADSLPYLGDIASLDRAWLEAHHAADEPVCRPDMVAALAPDQVPDLAPGLHASVRMLDLSWPVHGIWDNHRSGAPISSKKIAAAPETVIVWRPNANVISSPVSPAQADYLRRLGAGRRLGETSLATLDRFPDFDPVAAFGAALSAGYLAGVNHDPD